MKKHFLFVLCLVFKLLTGSAQAPAWQHLPGPDGGGIWTYPLPKTLTDPSQKPVFKIFPNPSQGELTLQSDSFFKEEIAFGVFDAAGRKVSEKRLSPGQYWNLDLPRLPKGLYFLQMRTESGVFGLKWVVEKALP